MLHALRRGLRRLERDDILVLILALAASWYLVQYLIFWVESRGLASSLSQGAWFAAASAAVVALWLFFGHRVRLVLEHRWPRTWELATTIVEFVTHTTPALIFQAVRGLRRVRPGLRVRFPLTMTFPAGLRDKLDANAIARSEWQGDTPSLYADVEWHFRNPNTMGIVRDADGVALGYFDFAPVSTTLVDQLRGGSVNEFDLVDHMLPDDQSCASLRQAQVFYVAGIASRTFKSSSQRRIVGAFLHWSMARILAESIFGKDTSRRVRFVAVAYGGDGSDGARFCEKARMRKAGTVVVDGDPSGDRHTWYELDATLADLKRGSVRLERILNGEFGRGTRVEVRGSPNTQQVYVLSDKGLT